jgi:hypothetical protein
MGNPSPDPDEDRVQHSIREEPALADGLIPAPGDNSPTHATWLAARQANTSAIVVHSAYNLFSIVLETTGYGF